MTKSLLVPGTMSSRELQAWEAQLEKDKLAVQARLAKSNPFTMLEAGAPLGDVLRECHNIAEGVPTEAIIYAGGKEYRLDGDDKLLVDGAPTFAVADALANSGIAARWQIHTTRTTSLARAVVTFEQPWTRSTALPVRAISTVWLRALCAVTLRRIRRPVTPLPSSGVAPVEPTAARNRPAPQAPTS